MGRTLGPAELQWILLELTTHPTQSWISTGSVTGTSIEESWPSYEYTDREIDLRTTAEIIDFKANPPASMIDRDYLFDHLDAIPFNIRYMYRISTRKEETFRILINQGRFNWFSELVRFHDGAELKDDVIIPYYLTVEDERYFAKVNPPAHASKRFNPGWNQQRTVAWDGQEFLIHNASPGQGLNHAIRQETPVLPSSLPDPLIAGLIPWGHGIYTLDNLVRAAVQGSETVVDGVYVTEISIQCGTGPSRSQIEARLIRQPSPQGRPAYALTDVQILKGEEGVFTANNSGHIWLEGRWVPTQIVTERPLFQYGAERTVRHTLLLEYRSEQISARELHPSLKDTWVEYHAPGLAQALRYQMSDTVDAELLLQEKLALMQVKAQDKAHALMHRPLVDRPGNCATLSLGHVSRALGHPIDERKLSSLVDGTGKSSLFELRKLARQEGFYCEVVSTDIDSLAMLEACQIILYLPDKSHFVVLGDVDTFDIQLIDLQKNTFLYSLNKHKFNLDWQEGIALVLSTDSIDFSFSSQIELPSDMELKSMRAGLAYDCTKLIQDGELYDIHCPDGPPCGGIYRDYSTIYGCDLAESGTCTNFIQWAYKEAICKLKSTDPTQCTYGRWTFIYYLYACY
jgi:hypothetical protein